MRVPKKWRKHCAANDMNLCKLRLESNDGGENATAALGGLGVIEFTGVVEPEKARAVAELLGLIGTPEEAEP